jgi:hypothetical protein
MGSAAYRLKSPAQVSCHSSTTLPLPMGGIDVARTSRFWRSAYFATVENLGRTSAAQFNKKSRRRPCSRTNSPKKCKKCKGYQEEQTGSSFLATSRNNLQVSIRIFLEKYGGRVGGWLRFRIASNSSPGCQPINWAAGCLNFEFITEHR